MKCKFCAEEIQESAILCRYCGARLEGGQWLVPERYCSNKARSSRKGSFTIKTTGLLFVLGAIFELSELQSAVALFGAVRSGPIAWVFHLVSVAFFLLAGLGLLEGSRRGLKAFYAMTVYFTLERLLYITDSRAIEAQLNVSSQMSAVATLISGGTAVEMMRWSSLITLLCTWGFALYIYYRRDYFR